MQKGIFLTVCRVIFRVGDAKRSVLSHFFDKIFCPCFRYIFSSSLLVKYAIGKCCISTKARLVPQRICENIHRGKSVDKPYSIPVQSLSVFVCIDNSACVLLKLQYIAHSTSNVSPVPRVREDNCLMDPGVSSIYIFTQWPFLKALFLQTGSK